MLKIHRKRNYQATTIINQLPIHYALCIFGKFRQITDQTFQEGRKIDTPNKIVFTEFQDFLDYVLQQYLGEKLFFESKTEI